MTVARAGCTGLGPNWAAGAPSPCLVADWRLIFSIASSAVKNPAFRRTIPFISHPRLSGNLTGRMSKQIGISKTLPQVVV